MTTTIACLFPQFSDDWKYVAMVLDRILLWMFTVACVIGKYFDNTTPCKVLNADGVLVLKNTYKHSQRSCYQHV